MARGRWKLLQTSIAMVLEQLADDLKGFQISAVLYYQAMSLMCFPYLAAFIFAGLFSFGFLVLHGSIDCEDGVVVKTRMETFTLPALFFLHFSTS